MTCIRGNVGSILINFTDISYDYTEKGLKTKEKPWEWGIFNSFFEFL